MTRLRSASPSVRDVDGRQAELELARVRQELRMRAFVLAVVVAIVLACTAAAIVGEPSVGNASTGVAASACSHGLCGGSSRRSSRLRQPFVHERDDGSRPRPTYRRRRDHRPSHWRQAEGCG